jgi:hypothetical protein
VHCLEEQHGREWRMSREFPSVVVLGTRGTPLTWTVPPRATNVFLCSVPGTEVAYRLNLEGRLGGADPSHFGNRLRNYLANVVWLSCRQVGPGRAVPLSKSKLMGRIRGGAWLVTETFHARPQEQAVGGAGVFTLPANSVNVPDLRNGPFK